MTAFRLTLELGEETRARWQHAADRAGFTLDEWIREYLDAASDPDAGEVASLPAAVTEAA